MLRDPQGPPLSSPGPPAPSPSAPQALCTQPLQEASSLLGSWSPSCPCQHHISALGTELEVQFEREKVVDLGLVLSCRPRVSLYFANRLAASLLLVWWCWSNARLLGQESLLLPHRRCAGTGVPVTTLRGAVWGCGWWLCAREGCTAGDSEWGAWAHQQRKREALGT